MRSRRFTIESGLAVPAILLAAGCLRTGLCTQPAEPVWLEPGKALQRHIAGGQSQEFTIWLQAGQFAAVWVEQRSVNIAIELATPDGRSLYHGDATRAGEPEIAEAIAETAGMYRVRVAASNPTDAEGVYEISLREVETAAERHRHRAAARQAFARATADFTPNSDEAARKAIPNFEAAAGHWRAAQDPADESSALLNLGWMYAELGEKPKALEYSTKAVELAHVSGDRASEAWALTCLGDVNEKFSDKKAAVEYYQQALRLWRPEERAGYANTLSSLGVVEARLGEKRQALAHFAEALEIYREFQDRRTEASIASNMGVTYASLGDFQRQLESYQRAYELQRAMNDLTYESITLNNIGTAYRELGEYQKALDALKKALELNRDQKRNTAVNLANIGRVYENLGDFPRALDYLERSTQLFREIKDKWGPSHTLNYIGEIQADLGQHRKSLASHTEALALSEAVGDPDMQAAAWNGIGSAYARLGDREKAREQFERAVAIHRRSGDPRLLADTLRNLGSLSRETGDFTRAAASLDEALDLRRTIHDRYGEAAELAELARLERDRGDLLKARERAEDALNRFESLRQTILSPKLRASLIASVHRVHELDLDVLARLHACHPEAGYDAAALFAAERGRARSLLEMLGESGAEIRRGVDAALTGRERELQRQIAAKAEQQMRLLGGTHSEAEAAAAAKELDALAADLDQVQSRIRETSPQYAALTQPAPLHFQEIQAKVLDGDTVLLEYALGTKKSFLWVATPSSLEMVELPPPAEIEAAVKHVYDLLTARNRQPANETPAARAARVRQADEAYIQAGLKVSRMLLGPAAARIRNKRLLIVADGVLQYLPFAALPEPEGARPEPLILGHEIATAPSASVVALLRQETAGRKPAEKAVAVLADPVYRTDDPRMTLHAVRSGGPAEANFERLRFSRTEAEEIARLSAPEPVFKALDFDASRDAVLRRDLGQYRIVHFATHSVIDNERPELSGVVLSLVDRSGRPQNGFLRLYDIYNLRLGADLVVLSACRTALGEQIRGEGLIGLTRGFLYAGAPRVVATLWEIDDRTTAEAMKRFYEGMLARGERPAAALRAAQASMWKSKGWGAPYYWAAFTLEGEWR